MSTFWSLFVTVLVIGNLIGVMWLLFATSSKKSDSSKGPEIDGVPSTGHEWDGIKELNHPLPRWWFNLFIITVVFSVVYMFLYPALGNAEGALNWTQLGQLEREMHENKEKREVYFKQFDQISFEDLSQHKDAMKTGGRLFANYCAACHGSDARGSEGFPDLSDGDWLYGNSEQALTQTILHGRQGMMPAYEGILSSQDIRDVASYVHDMSLGSIDPSKEQPGKKVFEAQCMACHGLSGEGNTLLGAPTLSDAIWLYGGELDQIKTTIKHGRNGRMPSHSNLLTESEARVLAAYITKLSYDNINAVKDFRIAR